MSNTHNQVKDMIKSFYPYAKKRYGFDQAAKIVLNQDAENSSKPLGKTAYYDPQNHSVTVYTHNRHPKDIMRSISHELVHHTQNCRGDLSNVVGEQGDGYAQKNDHLREMEREAYEQGNLCFRDWEDGIKSNLEPGTIYEKRNTNMATIKDHLKGRDANLFERVMDKFGYKTPMEEVGAKVDEGSDVGKQLWMQKWQEAAGNPQPPPQDFWDTAMYAHRQGKDPVEAAKDYMSHIEPDEDPMEEAHEGGEGVHDIFNMPEPEAVEPTGNPKEDALRQIVAQSQAAKVDGVMVDGYTASAIVQVLDAIRPDIKEKYLASPIHIMAKLAMSQVKEGKLKEYGDHETQAAGGLTNVSHSSDPEADQIQDIALDVVEKGGQLMQVATALQDQGFDASLKMGVLMIDNKYLLGSPDKFEMGPDEETREAGPYVVGYVNEKKLKEERGEYVPPGPPAPGPDTELIEKIAELMASDPNFRMLKPFVEKFKRYTKSGGAVESSLEAALPEYIAGSNISDVVKKAKAELGRAEEPSQRPTDPPIGGESDYEDSIGGGYDWGARFKNNPDMRKENQIKEALKRAFKKNPALIKVAKKIGVKKLAEEISKRDFQAQAWEKAGATSRTVSDEEAGFVESFNNWRNADPVRQEDWEPAQSYRGGRVLAYHRQDSKNLDRATGRPKVIQKHYDVPADMYVEDGEMAAILPEGNVNEINVGDVVLNKDDGKDYEVKVVQAGKGVVAVPLDGDGTDAIKIRMNKLQKKSNGDTQVMKEKTLTEGDFIGHHAMIDGEVYVDSNFLNKLNKIPEMGSLDHMGFGDFSFNSRDGKEMRFSRSGQNIPEQVGRSHKVYAHPPEFIEEVIAALESAGHTTSASDGEALPQGEPTMQNETIARKLHKLLEGKKIKKGQVNKIAKMVAAKLLEKKYKRDDEDEKVEDKDKKEDLDESGAGCGGGETVKLKVDRDGDEPGDLPGDGLEPLGEAAGDEAAFEQFAQSLGVSVQYDNTDQMFINVDSRPTLPPGVDWAIEESNPGYVVYAGNGKEQYQEDMGDEAAFEQWAESLGLTVQYDNDDQMFVVVPAEKANDPLPKGVDWAVVPNKDDGSFSVYANNKQDFREGKLPPGLEKFQKKGEEGKDGDADEDKDDKEESKTEGKLPPGLEKFQKKGKDGEDDDKKDDDKEDDDKEDLKERGYGRGNEEPGSMFDPYANEEDEYGGGDYGGEEDELAQYKDLLAALEGGGLEDGGEAPADVQAQMDAEFGGEEEEDEEDPHHFKGDPLQEWWDIRNARRTEKFMSWAIPKKK